MEIQLLLYYRLIVPPPEQLPNYVCVNVFWEGVVAQIKSIWARLSAIKKLEKSGFWGFKASVKRETVSL
jgi:hypothetical protein